MQIVNAIPSVTFFPSPRDSRYKGALCGVENDRNKYETKLTLIQYTYNMQLEGRATQIG